MYFYEINSLYGVKVLIIGQLRLFKTNQTIWTTDDIRVLSIHQYQNMEKVHF
jgi:hypothetical protein